MAKRKQVNLAAWAKAHEAEAKRAERNAKAFAGDDIGNVRQIAPPNIPNASTPVMI